MIYALDGTMLALLPPVGMLRALPYAAATLNKIDKGVQEQPQSKINSSSVITQR